MKTQRLVIVIMVFTVAGLHLKITAQVSINNDASNPHASAMLDVKSSTSGILIPRLTGEQIVAIPSPASGLITFCSANNQFYYNKGNESTPHWLILNSQWLNSLSVVAPFTGPNLYYTSGYVGIGTSLPQSSLSVGTTSQFQVNSTGNLSKVNNVTYSFPSSQGSANSVLQNDGAGNLTWSAGGGIKQVLRGTVESSAVTFSATGIYSVSLNTAKCVVTTRWTNTETPAMAANDLIVTSLTIVSGFSSYSITFRKSNNADNRIVEYQIIEYY